MKSWSGPLSVALYSTRSSLPLVSSFLESVASRRHFRVVVYVVYGKTSSTSKNNFVNVPFEEGTKQQHPETLLFPINELRNLALQNAQTTHVMVVDADLVVSGTSSLLLLTRNAAEQLRVASSQCSEESATRSGAARVLAERVRASSLPDGPQLPHEVAVERGISRRVDLVPLQKTELRQSVRDEEVLMNTKKANVALASSCDVVHHPSGRVAGRDGVAHSGSLLHEQGRVAVGTERTCHADS